jgi:LacI family transcriptional regulator
LSPKKATQGRRQHERVTASDVARRAGVSTMTVSRVINGDSGVRKSTRINVEKAIRELGYQPNKAARSLASANPIRIGLLYANPNSTYLSAMLIGILEQSRYSDTHIVVVECADGPEAVGVVEGLVADGYDGMVLAPPLCDSQRVFDAVKKHGLPAIAVGSRHHDDAISSVFIDDQRAAMAMTQHLVAQGHWNIGFINGDANQSSTHLRQAGYRSALLQAGIGVRERLVVPGEYRYLSGFEGARRLLDLPEPPTAIIGGNDDIAAGAIACAQQHGLEVPRDLSVCGFDDSMLATTVWPAITTIRQPIARMSQAAIELLEKDIRRHRAGETAECHRLQLDFTLVKRDSDAPPRSMKGRKPAPGRAAAVARRYGSGSSRKPPAL